MRRARAYGGLFLKLTVDGAAMGLLSGTARQVPGIWHILRGRVSAGVTWFAAFALAANFGLVAPLAWPGAGTRALRAVLGGAALLIWWLSRRSALRLDRGRRES